MMDLCGGSLFERRLEKPSYFSPQFGMYAFPRDCCSETSCVCGIDEGSVLERAQSAHGAPPSLSRGRAAHSALASSVLSDRFRIIRKFGV